MTTAPDLLLVPLAEGRRRLRLRAALSVALAALLAGTLVWLGAEGVERARRLGHLPLAQSVPVLGLVLGGAALVGAIAALVAFFRRVAGDGPLALLIDRRAGLGLAYATAVESARRAAPGPVAPLLVFDQRREAARLDLRHLLPLWVRPLSAALVACLLAGGLALCLHTTRPAPEESPLRQDPAPAGETRARARDLIEALSREAARRQDPMLAAIARAMAERVADAPPTADDRALADALDALTDQARAAFGATPPGWLETPGPGTAAGADAGAQGSSAEPKGDDTFAIDFNELDRARRAQAALRAAEDAGPDSEAAAGRNAGSDAGGAPAGTSPAPQRIDPAALQAAGREAVGAALDSGRGPADQAGAGSRTLDGEALTEAVAGESAMPLPEAAQDSGRRIRITLPPAEGSEAALRTPAGQSSGLAAPHTVERTPLPAGSRAAVGRYFERSAP